VKASSQQTIDRLAKRWANSRRLPVECTLGRKPLPRRGGACPDCTTAREFELDQAVAQLINTGAFSGTGVCPYQVITNHLVAGLVFGPEARRARSAGQYRADPMPEIKRALRHVRAITRSTGLSREDIEGISNKNDWWQAISVVFSVEHDLENALAMLRSQTSTKTDSPRGRTGALHIQAVARALALAWRELTGGLPAKDNQKFHDLLLAAVATIFGHPAKEPNWEATTRTAVEHINKDAAGRT